MDLFEFFQWCFKDSNSGIASIIVLGMLVNGLVRLVSILRGGTCNCDDDDDNDV